MTLTKRIQERLLRQLKPPPFACRHSEYSVIASLDDERAQPTPRLLDVVLAAADEARRIDLADLANRLGAASPPVNVWPGEHYRFLAGLAKVTQANRIVEIGTFRGMSALAFKRGLPEDGVITTVDIVKWDVIQPTALTVAEFEDGRLKQIITNLADADSFSSFAPTLEESDLIFADGPKDGFFEAMLMRQLDKLCLRRNPLVVLDDIRQWNMLKIWRDVQRPKMDATSLGHWTGTGVIDWNGPIVPVGGELHRAFGSK